MYEPKFIISNEILKNIGTIEACREVIENAPLIPYWEKRFQEEATLRTVHYGTHVEGNELSLDETAKILEGKHILARQRDVQEVINYRAVFAYFDKLGEKAKLKEKPIPVTEEQLKKINGLTCYRLIAPTEYGHYRKVGVVLRNSETGEIAFRPPPPVEVPYLLEDFFAWLSEEETKVIHPILRAGIAHYALVAIHPFIEGNGRTARAFATLVLFAGGYDIRKFFSLEESFDREAPAYFGALMSVSSQDPDLSRRDLTGWLGYFTKVLAVELLKIKEKVKKLSVDIKLKKKIGKQIALSERQMKMIEYLEENGQITTAEARKLLPMVSEDTVLRDLKDLVKKGIVRKEGKTKAARYLIIR